jgi:hypothetical protein
MDGKFRRRLCVLALAASWCGAGCDAILGPTPATGEWSQYDSARFSFLVRPGSFAEASRSTLADVLEDQYDETLRRLDLRYTGRISAYLFDSASDAGLKTNHSGVAYPDTESLRAVCVPPLDGNLFVLLSHEANHVIQKVTLGRPGTHFMNEGLPSAVLSTRYHSYGSAYLYDWTAANASAIPPLAVLVDDDRWDSSETAYKASASFLSYLLETHGSARIKSLYQVLSKDFQKQIAEIYGRPLEVLERDWREFCAAR